MRRSIARFRGRILQTFVTQLAFSASVFVAAIISARLLEPAGRGELAILVIVPTLLVATAEIGQEFTVSHLAARDGASVEHLHGNLVALAAAVVLPAFLICEASFRLLLDSDGTLPLAAIGGISVAAGVYLRGMSGLALGRGRIGLYNCSRLTLAGGSLVSALGLWVADIASPTAFYLGWCGSHLPAAALLAVGLRTPIARPNRETAAEQWRVGIRVHVANTCQLLLLRADVLLLGALASEVAVGQYVVATNVAEVLWYLPATVGLLSIPYLSAARPELEKVEALRDALRMSVWSSTVGGIALGALAPVLVPLVFGDAFRPAVLLLLLLIPGVIAAGVLRPCTAAFMARQQVGALVRIAGLALLVNVGLNLALIPAFGARGAALASTVSYALLGVLALRRAAALWNVRTADCLVPPQRLRHRLGEA